MQNGYHFLLVVFLDDVHIIRRSRLLLAVVCGRPLVRLVVGHGRVGVPVRDFSTFDKMLILFIKPNL